MRLQPSLSVCIALCAFGCTLELAGIPPLVPTDAGLEAGMDASLDGGPRDDAGQDAGSNCPAGMPQCCGDGTTSASETCDDGNRAAGDGCSETCAIETGAVCRGAPSECFFDSCRSLHDAAPSLASGAATIDPDGDGPVAPLSVHCDMATAGGGWTLIASWTRTNLMTTQTSDCDTLEAYCNVTELGWQAFGYTELMHAWSQCPGAYARQARAEHEDDTIACYNSDDSLNVTTGGLQCPANVGVKVWNDCACASGAQRRLISGYVGGEPLWASQHYVVDNTGLRTSAGSSGVLNYTCSSGRSGFFIR